MKYHWLFRDNLMIFFMDKRRSHEDYYCLNLSESRKDEVLVWSVDCVQFGWKTFEDWINKYDL